MAPIQKFVAGCMLQGCAVGLSLLMVGAPSANAAETPACSGSRTALEARITCAADQGPAALRNFVTRTRAIYQLDYETAVARADRFRTQEVSAKIASAK